MKKITAIKLAAIIIRFLILPATQQISAMMQHPELILFQKELEAAQHDPAQLANILQKKDPNFTDKSTGRSILQAVSQQNKSNIVAALLEAKADPNYVNKRDGYSALSYNATGFVPGGDCIPLLIQAKADINLHRHHPKAHSALDRAILCRNFAAILRLIAAGADIYDGLEYARDCYRRDRNYAEIVDFFEAITKPKQQEEKEDAPPRYEDDALAQYQNPARTG